MFDTGKTFCVWERNSAVKDSYDDDTADAARYHCVYQDPGFSISSFLYMVVLAALVVSVCTMPIDTLFGVLTAPTAETMKASLEGSVVKTVGRRITTAVVRETGAAWNALNMFRARPSPTGAAAEGISKSRSKSKGEAYFGLETRVLPVSTDEAHTLAAASMLAVADMSQANALSAQVQRMRMYQSTRAALKGGRVDEGYNDDGDDDDDYDNDDDNVDDSCIIHTDGTPDTKYRGAEVDQNNGVSSTAGALSTLDVVDTEEKKQKQQQRSHNVRICAVSDGVDCVIGTSDPAADEGRAPELGVTPRHGELQLSRKLVLVNPGHSRHLLPHDQQDGSVGAAAVTASVASALRDENDSWQKLKLQIESQRALLQP